MQRRGSCHAVGAGPASVYVHIRLQAGAAATALHHRGVPRRRATLSGGARPRDRPYGRRAVGGGAHLHDLLRRHPPPDARSAWSSDRPGAARRRAGRGDHGVYLESASPERSRTAAGVTRTARESRARRPGAGSRPRAFGTGARPPSRARRPASTTSARDLIYGPRASTPPGRQPSGPASTGDLITSRPTGSRWMRQPLALGGSPGCR